MDTRVRPAYDIIIPYLTAPQRLHRRVSDTGKGLRQVTPAKRRVSER
jgi:hypothetical protein